MITPKNPVNTAIIAITKLNAEPLINGIALNIPGRTSKDTTRLTIPPANQIQLCATMRALAHRRTRIEPIPRTRNQAAAAR